MNILVLGATGFVGSKVTEFLIAANHTVTCGVRNNEAARKQFPETKVVSCNFNADTDPACWLDRLRDIEIIINCVGIFYHADSEVIWNIHYHTPKALYEAALLTKVRCIIHLSALGIESYESAYAKSKLQAEVFLKSLSIPSIIVKPSFIVGAGAKGGLQLLQALAAFPAVMPLPGAGNQVFQPIYVEDLALAMARLVEKPVASNRVLFAVPKATIRLKELLFAMRQWLGLKKAVSFPIPLWLLSALALIGDKLHLAMFNSSAMSMLKKGNQTSVQNAQAFAKITGVTPLPFQKILDSNPASQAEKWFAKLFFAPILLRFSLAVMWLMSAFTSAWWYPKAASYHLLAQVGVSGWGQPICLYGASILNGLIGLGLLLRYKITFNCWLQMALIGCYTGIITYYLPHLWLEPFGPVVKNIPILVAVFLLYSLESTE